MIPTSSHTLEDIEVTLTAFEAIREKLVNGTYKKIAATTSTKYKIKTTSKKSVYYKVRAYKTTQGIRICGNFSGSVAVKR